MIRIIRQSKHSLNFYFDLDGVEKIVTVLQQALASNTLPPRVEVESSSNFTKAKAINYLIVSKNENENKIWYDSGSLILEINSDEIDANLQKFRECILGKDFYPAELFDMTLAKTGQEISLYGLLEKL